MQFAQGHHGHDVLTRTLAAASSNEEAEGNSWYPVSSATTFQRAEWMLNQMSFIGFYDQFELDIQHVFEKLKITPPVQHLNASNSSGVEVDEETMDLIRVNN